MKMSIEDVFSDTFRDIKDKAIAIYGIGNNSKIILNNIKHYNFRCVIAENYSEETFCGVSVCNIEKAVNDVDIILIAAVPTSTTAIYKRILDIVPKSIDVYDMRGHLLNKKVSAEEYLKSISINKTENKYTDLLYEKLKFTKVGKLCIDDYASIAYLIAPITMKYMQYIVSFAKEYDYILFVSRDGYFLYKLYCEFIKDSLESWARGIYFYTSRKALENAYSNENATYLNYIESLRLDGKGAVVDIVTQGSVCHGISVLTGNMLDLIALGTTAVPNRYVQREESVHSMLGNVNEEVDGIPYSFFDFSELHLFLEILYASEDGQFLEFSEGLLPCFDVESKYDKMLIKMVQKELKQIINSMIENEIKDFSNDYITQVLNLFYKNFADYDEKIKGRFCFDDPYDDRLQNCNLIDKLGW